MDAPETRAVVSLSRGPNLPVAGAGASPWGDRTARKAAIAFLAARPRWPGAGVLERAAATEAEVDTMDARERVFLEIEMMQRQREQPLHSFEYDPCAGGPG
jgi:hypothetical protein